MHIIVLKLVYIQIELLHVSTNHLVIFRNIGYKN